ncbi:hybrid sensor histidine kinase/response regulator [Roseibium polysiphoniae]|uniref:histidine kinase n=1 Tax=Roseibium polysiphoniae TaxID=2571221 RepID=A0A944GSQ4_9HYPH|nr:HWE histidine kinase domain-containing protein [Roseibium polysiphoniae]MBS8259821.1 hybrid sensor histidine kinase/response regulator [Roseibium polysiphoniae]
MTTVDLTNCDREPIQFLGGVQAFGCLLAFSNDWLLAHVSENCVAFTGRTPEELSGVQAVHLLGAYAFQEIRGRLQWLQYSDATERLFGLDLFGDGKSYDAALHRSGDLIILECEPSEMTNRLDAISAVRSMMARIDAAEEFDEFLSDAARQVRAVTDFDRVMVYRFMDDGSGQVVAESRAPGVDSFLGLRYPASDIPVQARQLYIRNQFRIISDVNGKVARIVPAITTTGEPLDLSLSVLRSVSEIHLEYLRNMGVGASLSISIIVDGRLWGLFACHHYSPKQMSFDRRTTAELFSQMFSRDLARRLQDEVLNHEERARVLHDRIMSSISVEGSVFQNLSSYMEPFMDVVSCDGVAVLVDGQYTSLGLAARKDELEEFVPFLNRTAASKLFSTHTFSKFLGESDFTRRIPGLLAIPVSRRPRDYLLFFRGEVVQSVTWAGNPEKPVELGPNGPRLTPRKSFEAWKQEVVGQSAKWTAAELKICESLRTTLLEVILRSVDMNEKLQKEANERQDTLIAELNHRVRNILTLIQGLVSRTMETAESTEHFTKLLDGRIKALARAHDQITQDQWSPAPLTSLFTNELKAFSPTYGDSARLLGPHVMIAPLAFSTMALVVHEMVTNSAKHGALSASGGFLTVEWTPTLEGDLEISWIEAGGPPVVPPSRRGFGSTIIEHSIPHELNGEATIEYLPEGVRASFRIPADYVELDKLPQPPTIVRAVTRNAVQVPRSKALLVEDNMIIALDNEDMLREIGFVDVALAKDVETGLEVIAADKLDFALLDINLGRENSIPIAQKLRDLGVPFIFASGYEDTSLLDESFKNVPVVIKPFSKEKLEELVSLKMEED